MSYSPWLVYTTCRKCFKLCVLTWNDTTTTACPACGGELERLPKTESGAKE